LLIFIFQSLNSQAQKTHDYTTQFTKGDTIAIGYSPKNVEDNLKPAIDLLHSWGLEVVIGNTIGLDNNQLAGTDEQRAADFQQIRQSNIKAIWCVKAVMERFE
jgi:muramoyltetrapeptide carboxypeptidase